MSKTAFCVACGEKEEYDVRTETVKLKYKGVSFVYESQIAACKVCGIEMYIPKLNDANVDAANAAYERAKGDSHD